MDAIPQDSKTAQALTQLRERLAQYLAQWPEDDADLSRRVDQLHVDLIDDPRGTRCHSAL